MMIGKDFVVLVGSSGVAARLPAREGKTPL